ncbi:MAG: hypothetical protein OXJ55_07930 [Caldilineaceae bacterium]|nr:hypothetical protein [Caldilineaceae bacterium]
MSSKFREYVQDRLLAVEEEAALLRNALDVLTDYEAEESFRTELRSKSKEEPAKRPSKAAGRKKPAGKKAATGKKKCSVEGCTNVVVAKGLCRKCYDRANPRPSRGKKAPQPAQADESAPDRDPDQPVADPALIAKASPQADRKLPKNRVPCGHPHCDASVPYTGGIPDEPMYCSDFCRNNHARILAETAAN